MKIKITESFQKKLNAQVDFIAKDKVSAARKFKIEIISRIRALAELPFKNRKSIFFEREDIRDMVYKGYVIIYRVNSAANEIEVFGFVKYQEFKD